MKQLDEISRVRRAHQVSRYVIGAHGAPYVNTIIDFCGVYAKTPHYPHGFIAPLKIQAGVYSSQIRRILNQLPDAQRLRHCHKLIQLGSRRA